MRTILITGANSGFGYYMALEFARNNDHVYTTTRNLNKEGVTRLNKIAKDENLKIHWLVLDVTDSNAIKEAISEITKMSGSLDILINNAGYGILGALEDYTSEDFVKQLNTNLFGVVDMTYNSIPLLRKSNAPVIINISSIAGLISAPGYGIYSSSKWALEAYTEALRYEFKKDGFRVALIEPGGFDTSFSDNSIGLNPDTSNFKKNWFTDLRDKRNSLNSDYLTKLRNPRKVARLTLKISNSKNPKLRNVIGYDAKTFYFLRRLLPARLWEYAVTRIVK